MDGKQRGSKAKHKTTGTVGRTQLAELSIGDDKSAQGPQAVEGLVTVLLSSLLIDRSTGTADGLGIPMLGLPDEVLEKVALVLG